MKCGDFDFKSGNKKVPAQRTGTFLLRIQLTAVTAELPEEPDSPAQA